MSDKQLSKEPNSTFITGMSGCRLRTRTSVYEVFVTSAAWFYVRPAAARLACASGLDVAGPITDGQSLCTPELTDSCCSLYEESHSSAGVTDTSRSYVTAAAAPQLHRYVKAVAQSGSH